MTSSNTIELLHDLQPTIDEFRAAVIAGLSAERKTLPCKFFYDAAGSQLFDRICELPEYYPTRTECRILEDHADDIAELLGPYTRLCEFGSGAGVKIRLLLAALDRPAAYVPIDISREHMLAAAAELGRDFPGLRIAPVCADYTKPFALPAIPGVAPRMTAGFFPGSTLGNFTPPEAIAFLSRMRRLLGPESSMVIGVDLPKDAAILNAAYDDAAGVTAAFNLNLLHRINRELDAKVDVESFVHKAWWNPAQSRVEMHLVSSRQQEIRIGDEIFAFAEGETIHTENSYKYSLEQFGAIAADAGYNTVESWTDERRLFSVHVIRAA